MEFKPLIGISYELLLEIALIIFIGVSVYKKFKNKS